MKIILMNTHDMGRCIGPYGFPARTPRLQELAESGVVFRRAFTVAPTCSPSRAALFTGRYPHQAGMFGLVNFGFTMSRYDNTLVSFLNGHGFRTALAGVQHIAPDSKTVGYQRVLDPQVTGDVSTETYTAEYVVGDSGEWDYQNALAVRDFLIENRHENLFISFGLGNTHRDFDYPGDANDGAYLQPLPGLPDTTAMRRDAAGFVRAVEEVDRCVGVVLDAIKEHGLEDEVVFVFTTDHGPPFPFMKCTLKDAGTGISLLIMAPGCESGGVVEDIVGNIDIFPTLCDLASLAPPDNLVGRSLVPLMKGGTLPPDRDMFGEINHHVSFQPTRCIRTERYKYIRYFGESRRLALANVDAGYGKRFLLDNGLLEVPQLQEELYDLYLDPHETNNLCNPAMSYEVRATRDALRTRLAEWMESHDDPLTGSNWIVPPDGAQYWDDACIDHVKSIYRTTE